MILLIDNYDSFAHNLARYFVRLEQTVRVVRNDAIDVATVRQLQPAAMVLSPGPCTPREAGASLDIVRQLHGEFPMLGVCLGHQVIAEALGGHIERAPLPMHGQTSSVTHHGKRLFAGLPSPMKVARYHSLIANTTTLPPDLQVSAATSDGVLMAFEHVQLPVFGVQFHPESILTEFGYEILTNFLVSAGIEVSIDPQTLRGDELKSPPIVERTLPTGPVTF